VRNTFEVCMPSLEGRIDLYTQGIGLGIVTITTALNDIGPLMVISVSTAQFFSTNFVVSRLTPAEKHRANTVVSGVFRSSQPHLSWPYVGSKIPASITQPYLRRIGA
jgi:hypothetical protein